MAHVGWESSETLAWTEREGPGRPPRGPNRLVSGALAGALGVVFVGMMSTDALCPEHRAWVQALAGAALVGTVVAIVGLLREWATAPLLTVVTAGTGVLIGLIDAAHDPTRGRLIAVAFAVITVATAVAGVRQLRLHRWDRASLAALRGTGEHEAPPALAPAGTPAPASPARTGTDRVDA